MKKLSDIREEVANITVDPRNRIKKSADQNKHALAIAKNAKRMGLKSAMMGKHVRVSGNKKAVNDFLRITIGKSSYGDPTEKDMTTPQIDKMLNKGLKEKSYGAGEEGTDELKKKYKKDTPMESLEENAIPKIKQIVAKKQAMKIDGVMVDMFTASAISQIYDKVNDANKKKMEKMKVTQLANAAMKLMRRNSVNESLWANIHKKRERIKRGSGEKMRNVGDKGAPTPDQLKRAKGEEVDEKVKDGKLDPLSKMGKSKLTGQEIAKYYKDNPKAKQAARDKTVKKAIELALDLGGSTNYAIKEIEKLKRGLSKNPVVKLALRHANESLEEAIKMDIKQPFVVYKKIDRMGMSIKPLATLKTMPKGKMLDKVLDKHKADGVMSIDRIKRNNIKLKEGKMKDVAMDAELMGLYTKAMKIMPGSPKQKEIIKQINKRRKSLGLRENMKDKAFRDFRRQTGGRRGVDPADQDMKATDDDRKAASKNIIMQLRRVSDLPRGGKVEFENGKTINVTKKDAVKIGQFFDRLRKPQDKAKFQAMIYKSPADMKKILSKIR